MKIVVIGAYGYTGKLICEEFERHSIVFSIAGRNWGKLKLLKDSMNSVERYFVCDIKNPNDTIEMLNFADVVVNCAGPFTEESSDFLEFITKFGKVYIDITGEVEFVKNSREKHHDPAQTTGALLIHGAAFESMLVDLVLQQISLNQTPKKIKVFYHFNQKRVSPGTRITMKLSKFRNSLHIMNGEWKTNFISEDFKTIEIGNEHFSAVPYPLPEIAFAYWNYKPEEINTYLLLDKDEAKFVSQVKKPSAEILTTLEKLKTLKKDGPTVEERLKQKCRIVLQVDDSSRIIESMDMYQITAICIRMITHKIKINRNKINGVISPAQLFRGEEQQILDALQITVSQSVELNSISK